MMVTANNRIHKEIRGVIELLVDFNAIGIENMANDDLEYVKNINNDLITYKGFVEMTVNALEIRYNEEKNEKDAEELKYYRDKVVLFEKFLPKLQDCEYRLEQYLSAS
ncbi:hypothetical protein [Staphylococcus gallinarum]|uniref:hypothetical protein n=1 Tax=Staphylococcus gallinarum TaxID=1293 RepID=UPI0030BC40A4